MYLQLVEWIDLGPWNNFVDGSNGQEQVDLLLGVLTVVLVLALWGDTPAPQASAPSARRARGGRIATLGAVAATGAWAALQIATWWVPYVQGATPAWQRTYARWFADNVQVLPGEATPLPPDANHLVLHVLIAVAFVLSLIAARAARGSSRPLRRR